MSFRSVNGNTRSENGWKLVNRDECVLVPGPFMNTAPLRRGPAEIVLGEFVRRHHVKVKPITSPVWGWSRDNDVLGQPGMNNGSNHLGGTAIDVDAPRRPWKYYTMSQDLIKKTDDLLAEFNHPYGWNKGPIFWGRWWNTPDEMHFQLNWKENDPRWGEVIARIQGGPIIAPPIPSIPQAPNGSWAPTLQYGSQGSAVLELQRDLNRAFRGYPMMPLLEDADFGPATRAAIIEFQRRVEITADGIVGPQTWARLAEFGVKL